jgi:uncharacterized protein
VLATLADRGRAVLPWPVAGDRRPPRPRAPARTWLRALALTCLALLAVAVAAQDLRPVPPLTARVMDEAGALPPTAVGALDARLERLERERGSQLVVLVVRSTQPEDIAAFAQRVGEDWKIGRREVGDGVLIVVAVDDRRVRIEVAKALEGAIPDLAARRIITEQITPAFRAGDYAGGLAAAVEALDTRIAGEGLPEPSAPAAGSIGDAGLDLHDVAIFLFVAVPIVATVLTSLFGRRLGSLLTAAGAGGLGWWFTASLVVAAGAAIAALVVVGLFGVGAARRSGLGRGRGPAVIWGGGHHGGGWSSGGFGGGGGGFGSGGGGDFGGGGASGDW